MKRTVLLILTAVFLLGAPAQLQAQSKSERRMLAYAKRMDVRYLDRSLPSQTFAGWLSRVLGSGSRMAWELNDCGERTRAETRLRYYDRPVPASDPRVSLELSERSARIARVRADFQGNHAKPSGTGILLNEWDQVDLTLMYELISRADR